MDKLLLPEYFSAEELARMCKKHVQTIYNWMRTGKIPCREVGGKTIHRDDLDHPFLRKKLNAAGWKPPQKTTELPPRHETRSYLISLFDKPENHGYGPHKITLEVLLEGIAPALDMTVEDLEKAIARFSTGHKEECCQNCQHWLGRRFVRPKRNTMSKCLIDGEEDTVAGTYTFPLSHCERFEEAENDEPEL